ncbi:MAG: hypothetical protein HUU01_24100 [Saprospiraceae bacterium]|nr:hypothetical protein [Saprospiraceae bacterium]
MTAEAAFGIETEEEEGTCSVVRSFPNKKIRQHKWIKTPENHKDDNFVALRIPSSFV